MSLLCHSAHGLLAAGCCGTTFADWLQIGWRGDLVATRLKITLPIRPKFSPNFLILLVPQEGFEPPTPSLRISTEDVSKCARRRSFRRKTFAVQSLEAPIRAQAISPVTNLS